MKDIKRYEVTYVNSGEVNKQTYQACGWLQLISMIDAEGNNSLPYIIKIKKLPTKL